jgi:paraquat-inducible protein A
MACPECDLLHRIGPVPADQFAVCHRCGAQLRRGTHGSIDIPLALSITALVLFGFSNAYPLLSLQLHGSIQEATIGGCVTALIRLGWPWLAAILITTVLVAPPIYLAGLAYVLVRTKLRRLDRWTLRIFRIVQEFQPWGMTSVFLLGVMVAFVKLKDMAIVLPGASLFALAGFIVVMASLITTLDPNDVWDTLEEGP